MNTDRPITRRTDMGESKPNLKRVVTECTTEYEMCEREREIGGERVDRHRVRY